MSSFTPVPTGRVTLPSAGEVTGLQLVPSAQPVAAVHPRSVKSLRDRRAVSLARPGHRGSWATQGAGPGTSAVWVQAGRCAWCWPFSCDNGVGFSSSWGTRCPPLCLGDRRSLQEAVPALG